MGQYITTVTAGVISAPFGGGSLGNFTGFEIGPYITSSGSVSSATINGHTLFAAGWIREGSPYELAVQINANLTTATFTTLTVIQAGNGYVSTNTFASQLAGYWASGSTNVLGVTTSASVGTVFNFSGNLQSFVNTSATTLIFQDSSTGPVISLPIGHGDITDPEAWQDTAGNVPPNQFSNVPYNVNYPLNGDGRYWFETNAFATNTSGPIIFIGDPLFVSDGSANLQWSVVQAANDGSTPMLAYLTSGSAWTTATLSSAGTQLGGIQNGQIIVPLNTLTSTAVLEMQVYSTGGISSASALPYQIAVAITRNVNEGLSWDAPNPFDPTNYNAACMDNVVPTATMASLSARILVRLGFANQATNPPPGMALLVQDFLTSAQTYLYKRYLQLHTKRFFRWKVNPLQRFYSLKDNDEDVLCNFTMDPLKSIEWAGIQDTRNVWYPLIQGIPPQLYTMITKPWRPARYDIRQAIELYPAPDQTYWLWIKGHFGLMSFINPTDSTTLDSELVFLHALANAKSHYGQPDANNIEAQANAYRAELIAGTHQTAHYVPGTIAVPPAVRPTLIQFDSGNGGA
jgi:hypothetical protein